MNTNAELQQMYRHFNKKWFKNRLPKNLRIAYANIDGLGITNFEAEKPKSIQISQRIQWSLSETAMTLFHEMVHVSLPYHSREHGRKFQREMLRLAKAGAFKGRW